MRRTALSHLLAAIGRTRVIAAALRNTDEIERRVVTQISISAFFDAETRSVLDMTAARFAEARKLARREALAAELGDLASSLSTLARLAAAELAATAHKVRSDPSFELDEAALFEVAAVAAERSAA